MPVNRLRFGAFIAPFHQLDENPSVMLECDLKLVQLMDDLGYDEAWFGEHHSGGWEISASPEVMIAVAAERTRNIRLGTGVSSLPYHHPFILADRIRQLDHLTRGRTMLGVGPGSLPSDAYMQGIPTAKVRDRMEEAVEVIVRLLDGETVTKETEWFTLNNARLQLLPYNEQGVEISVANQVSPTGARTAGRLGLNLLSIGATSGGGFNALASAWQICEDMARDHGQTVDRSGWRLVGPMHIAETREKAREEVKWGFYRWIDYFTNVAALPLAPPPGVDPLDAIIDSGFAVVGTPDDAIAQIKRLQEQSGGFGCFLNMTTSWADWGATHNSVELIARHVMPAVNQLNVNRCASEDWLRHNSKTFRSELQAAVGAKVAQHAAEKGTANLQQELIAALVPGKP
ncbi:LLM class flavin-dependent oxidoreductase [Novosphingobium lentum]|uniref:LLM class flavin-dependent oxidoreductase n=1 Tax=Novosphingobium lentum TaxID=145287 RepID=UPI000832B936|nr:LLM class flavin-dependent oxidoreductase [Novosphingobium lentum]